MTYLKIFINTIKNTFVLSGRSNRKELIVFSIFSILYMILSSVILSLLIATSYIDPFLTPIVEYFRSFLPYLDGWSGAFALLLVFFIITTLPPTLPMISLSVRRFHDISRSGHWAWVFWIGSLVPYIGFLVTLVGIGILSFVKSTPGNNQYGEEPQN